MNEFEYLSDDELMSLIDDIEQNELISAPVDITENVLALISKTETSDGTTKAPAVTEAEHSIIKPPRVLSFEEKKKEYRRFCFRVIASMVAAVALVIALPFIKDESYEISSKEFVVGTTTISNEEVLDNPRNRITETISSSHYIFNSSNNLFN